MFSSLSASFVFVCLEVGGVKESPPEHLLLISQSPLLLRDEGPVQSSPLHLTVCYPLVVFCQVPVQEVQVLTILCSFPYLLFLLSSLWTSDLPYLHSFVSTVKPPLPSLDLCHYCTPESSSPSWISITNTPAPCPLTYPSLWEPAGSQMPHLLSASPD